VRRVGPNSLRHFKRTYKAALKRQIAMGTYNRRSPIVIPHRDDMRYRSWKTEEEPVANAVIIYMMDVSGSMGDEQKEIVRIESFWIDAWLQKQYKGVETRFIIHDAVAREVDRGGAGGALEGALEHEILRRVAGEEELGKDDEVRALNLRLAAGLDGLLEIACDVAHDGIQLGKGDAELVGHFTSKSGQLCPKDMGIRLRGFSR